MPHFTRQKYGCRCTTTGKMNKLKMGILIYEIVQQTHKMRIKDYKKEEINA